VLGFKKKKKAFESQGLFSYLLFQDFLRNRVDKHQIQLRDRGRRIDPYWDYFGTKLHKT
jgi:hypothetical protein